MTASALRSLRLVVVAGALPTLLLCACVGDAGDRPDDALAVADGPGPPRDGQARGGPPGGPIRPLFISPAGEPFHGAPDGPTPAASWFAQADADHDGKLTRAELTADHERFFRLLDVNADGVIDGFEAQAYERKIAPQLLPQVGSLRAGEGQDDRLFIPGRVADAAPPAGVVEGATPARNGREAQGRRPLPAPASISCSRIRSRSPPQTSTSMAR